MQHAFPPEAPAGDPGGHGLLRTCLIAYRFPPAQPGHVLELCLVKSNHAELVILGSPKTNGRIRAEGTTLLAHCQMSTAFSCMQRFPVSRYIHAQDFGLHLALGSLSILYCPIQPSALDTAACSD